MGNKFLIIFLFILPSVSFAQEIKWKRVIGANVSSLSKSDKNKAAKLMRKINSYYGCSDTIAKCLIKSPKCETARRIAGIIVRFVVKGKSEKRIKKEVLKRGLSAHPFKVRKIKFKKNQCTSDPKKAKFVIAAYSDFLCPFCAVILPILEKIVRKNSKVSLCFKHFPTLAHKQPAINASLAAIAASKQGKFWKYHDILYKNRKTQSSSNFLKWAKSLGLNMEKFKKDSLSRSSKRIVAKEKREGLKFGVKGTPTLFFNGKKYSGRKDSDELKDRISEELHLISGGN
jgi:protein-disulfide isomerase